MVDEQHGLHGVGSMTELILKEPFTDESYVSESELSAEQTVEAGEIAREAVIARTYASSQSMVHQEEASCARYAGNVVCCAVPQPPSCCPECRRMTFVHPNPAHSSRLAPVRGPAASRVCYTLLWYTARVSQTPGAQDGPAPSFACLCRRGVFYWPGG